MNVFRGLAAVLEPADRRTLRRVTVLAAVHGLAQGVTMVLVVPVARALAAGETGSAWTWLLVLGMSVLVTGVVGYAQAMGGFRLAVAAMRTLHLRVGDHLARLPVGWFTGRTGELSELLSRGVLTVGGSPGYLLTPLVTLTTSATTVAAGLLLIDVRLGLIALLLGAGVLVVARAATALGSRGDEAQHRAVVEVDDRIVEFARCQGAIRASGASARYEPLGRALADHEGRARQGLWSSVVALGLNGLAAQTAFSLVVLALVALALRGTLDPVEMVATFALVSRFVEPINEIGAYRSGVRSTGRAIDRLGAVLGAPTLPEPADPVDGRGGAVELDGVTFAYEPGRPVLTDVSLRVGPGTTTAVVGASGAGKTTLLRLVARERDVDAGRVLVGGVDVRDRSSSGLAADLTAVLQDVYLLEGTLRENVLIGNLAATDAELGDVARCSGVDEIVARLPEGWDSEVGEGGVRLSGGERQRVAVARALLKPAEILLLDEATAALDPVNEHVVTTTIDGLRGRRTVLVLAHRLPTIAGADQIVVLADGRVAQRGTHAQLLAQDGPYAALWRSRLEAEGWVLGAG